MIHEFKFKIAKIAGKFTSKIFVGKKSRFLYQQILGRLHLNLPRILPAKNEILGKFTFAHICACF